MMDLAQVYGVAQSFVTAYYQVFDSDRTGLANFYHEQSLLNFESQDNQIIVGKEKIAEKLVGLGFTQVSHAITTIDAQPTIEGGILIVVNGQLKTDGESHTMPFTQTFYLTQRAGSFFIDNDIFRLGVHNF